MICISLVEYPAKYGNRIAKGDLACLKNGEWVSELTVLPFANECHEYNAVLDHNEYYPLLRQPGICGLAINSPLPFCYFLHDNR